MDSNNRVMENSTQDHHQQPAPPPQALKCPRCDSSNTKFCYYNNYSLSQPRHFCKACKRYWTRGGTLRNVPVGGGCRKNKRVKRPSTTSAVDHHTPSSSSSANANPSVQPQIDLSSSTSNNHINPLFYGLPTNPSELNLSYPRFNSRVSGYDLQPQMNGLGLGFSSGVMGSEVHNDDYRNGYSSNSILSSYPMFGSSISSSSPTMASLLASTLQQQKIISGGLKDIRAPNSFMGLVPYEDMQMTGSGEGVMAMKEVKMEEAQNRLDWNIPHRQNQIEQMGSSDPSLMWNTTGVGAWLDPSNIGSSVPSLI